MTTLPKLQESNCGLSLRTGTYLILSLSIALTFFGLVIVTAKRVGTEENESELDFNYIIKMVLSILVFLASPLALYGTYRERSVFLTPYLVMKVLAILTITINITIEFFALFGKKPPGLTEISIMIFLLATVMYSFLVVFSYYSVLKEQREEIQ